MQVCKVVEEDHVTVFILDSQVRAIMPLALLSVAIRLQYPPGSLFMSFLQPEKQPVIGPIRQFARRDSGIDVFIVLIPALHDSIQALDLFQR